MTETCTHRRSRWTSPVAFVAGAVLLSGSSAYAATTITGAQIKNETVTSADLKNGSVASIDIANGSLAAGDLKAGVANRLVGTSTRIGASLELSSSTSWQFVLPTSVSPAHKVGNLRRFTVSGVVGYGSASAVDVDVAICSSVNGGAPARVGSTYNTVTVEGRVAIPVQGETTASGVTVRVGPCLRGASPDGLVPDVSSVSTLVTLP